MEAEAQVEPRIKLVFREENGNISAASNSALALATGDFLVLLDHDDILAPHALAIVADAINRHPDADVLYSDEDKLNAQGHRYGAYFKPDWNRNSFTARISSAISAFTELLVRALGGFRLGFEGSQDYDLALRATAATKGPCCPCSPCPLSLARLPGRRHLLLHSIWARRRCRATRHQGTAGGVGRRRGASATPATTAIASFARTPPWPRVSVVVSSRQHPEFLFNLIKGLLEKTDYPDMEIIVVHASEAEQALPTEILQEGGFGAKPEPC